MNVPLGPALIAAAVFVAWLVVLVLVLSWLSGGTWPG
jgi:hypothetical protein